MTFKINRRDFLKTTGMIPAFSILPSWSISALSHDDNMFAIDFVWQCKSPFDGPGDEGTYSDYDGELTFDMADFGGNACQKNFLVRGFLRGENSGIPTQNQEVTSQGPQSINQLASFHCPSCETGWWLGYTARGFKETFFFSELQGIPDLGVMTVSKVIVPPLEGSCFVREGDECWFKHMAMPLGSINPYREIDDLVHRTQCGATIKMRE